jgi:hypothetical protein
METQSSRPRRNGFIGGANPRDELECALVIQMACTHSAAMAVLNMGKAAAAIEVLR